MLWQLEGYVEREIEVDNESIFLTVLLSWHGKVSSAYILKHAVADGKFWNEEAWSLTHVDQALGDDEFLFKVCGRLQI